MPAPTCTQTLAGLFAGITLHCSLDKDHHGRCEAPFAGYTVEWNPNTYRLTEAVAA